MRFGQLSIWEKGWRVFDLQKQVFVVSRDIIFEEDVFPFSTSDAENGRDGDDCTSLRELLVEEEIIESDPSQLIPTSAPMVSVISDDLATPIADLPTQITEVPCESDVSVDILPSVPDASSISEDDAQRSLDREGTDNVPPVTATTEHRRGHRSRRPPAYLAEYQTGLVCSEKNGYISN